MVNLIKLELFVNDVKEGKENGRNCLEFEEKLTSFDNASKILTKTSNLSSTSSISILQNLQTIPRISNFLSTTRKTSSNDSIKLVNVFASGNGFINLFSYLQCSRAEFVKFRTALKVFLFVPRISHLLLIFFLSCLIFFQLRKKLEFVQEKS